MAHGPIELLVVEFPGNQFNGEIAPALADLVDSGMIRVIDFLFVTKDADGNVDELELGDLSDEAYAALDPLIADLEGLITHEDAVFLAEELPTNSSAGVMLFENVWAKRFADAVANANGQVLINERIPRAAIEELEAEHAG